MESLSANGGCTTYVEGILNADTAPRRACTEPWQSVSSAEEKIGQVEALSKRELEVLRLISVGKTNNEIAGQLFIANATVKFHVSNIFGKLKVTNRTMAVATARNCGLIL